MWVGHVRGAVDPKFSRISGHDRGFLRHVRLASFLVIAVPCTTSARAFAERADSASTPENSQRAETLYAQAKAAAARKDFAQAYELFKAAWQKKPAYDTAGNLGHTALLLNKNTEAADYLTYCVQNFPSGDPSKRERIADLLEKARRRVLTVRLHVEPNSAVLRVDGRELNRVAGTDEVFLEPGAHTISVSAASYRAEARAVAGDAGSEQTVEFTLERVPSEDADNHLMAPQIADSTATPLAHRDEESEYSQSRSEIPTIVGAAIFGAGIATGIGFQVAAHHKQNDADRLSASVPSDFGCARNVSATCAELRHAQDAVDRDKNVALTSLGIGAAGGLFALSYYLFWPRKSTDQGIHAAADVRPNGASVWMTGTF